MARLRVSGTVHAGAGVWRVHNADGNPMLRGPATLRTAARGPPADSVNAGRGAYCGQSEFSIMSTKLARW
jgi:hypothetical protein